jgi:hypothetical protein
LFRLLTNVLGDGGEQQDAKKKKRRNKQVHDPDQPPKKLLKKDGPAYFHFPWLFLVPDETDGDSMKEFAQFPVVFKEKFNIKFEEAYIQAKGWKPVSSYGTISNNPELQSYRVNKNEGRCCLAEGMRLSSRPFRYTNAGGNTDRPCDSCSKEGRPCGKFKKINGEFFIVFSPRAEQNRPNCQ